MTDVSVWFLLVKDPPLQYQPFSPTAFLSFRRIFDGQDSWAQAKSLKPDMLLVRDSSYACEINFSVRVASLNIRL